MRRTALALSWWVSAWACGCGDDAAASVDSGAGIDSGTDVDSGGPGDAGGVVDAPSEAGSTDAGIISPDFSCEGVALPTPPATLHMSARLRDEMSVNVEGATVQVRARADDALIVEGTTDATGTFTYDLETAGAPADVYLEVHADGFPTTFLYTGWPLFEDEAISYSVYSLAALAAFATMLHVTIDPDKGGVHAIARDCALHPVERAELVSSAPAEEMSYVVGARCFSPQDDLSETNRCGAAAFVNVDPGRVTVTGSVIAGPTFRVQDLRVEAGSLTRVSLRPDRP